MDFFLIVDGDLYVVLQSVGSFTGQLLDLHKRFQ